MARRKKEAEGFHRDQIAQAAQELFQRNGISGTTMDEIAKHAGYSKATLYVYFQHKEDLVADLVLRSMELLQEHLCQALATDQSTWEKYKMLCQALVQYQRDNPFYFETALGEIQTDVATFDKQAPERETVAVGERINQTLANYLNAGIEKGDLRPNLNVLQTVFVFWASLSGLVLLSVKKQAYLEEALGQTRTRFLEDGFALLYRAIAAHPFDVKKEDLI